MMVSNGPNGSSPPDGFGRRIVRAVARAMVTVAIVTVAVAPLARPAGAQETGATTVVEAAVPTPGAPALSTMPATADALMPPAPAAAPKKTAHDLTPIGMFLAADPIVQGVMVVLAAASVVVWVILLVRGVGLFLAKRRLRAAILEIGAAEGLADASARVRSGIAARLLLEAEMELDLSRGLQSDGVKERVLMALERVEAGVGRRMAAGTGILATVGSTGPFVGLFGTVWGIMRSFIGIANANTTNLAVVAPGIAEALLATGIGLVAAIPAVVIYNVLSRSITGYRALCGDAVALIMRHLSRDLDRRKGHSSASAPSGVRAAAE